MVKADTSVGHGTDALLQGCEPFDELAGTRDVGAHSDTSDRVLVLNDLREVLLALEQDVVLCDEIAALGQTVRIGLEGPMDLSQKVGDAHGSRHKAELCQLSAQVIDLSEKRWVLQALRLGFGKDLERSGPAHSLVYPLGIDTNRVVLFEVGQEVGADFQEGERIRGACREGRVATKTPALEPGVGRPRCSNIHPTGVFRGCARTSAGFVRCSVIGTSVRLMTNAEATPKLANHPNSRTGARLLTSSDKNPAMVVALVKKHGWSTSIAESLVAASAGFPWPTPARIRRAHERYRQYQPPQSGATGQCSRC